MKAVAETEDNSEGEGLERGRQQQVSVILLSNILVWQPSELTKSLKI